MKYLNWYLFGTVFITGAAVLILEVAAVRLLSPYYGSSLYVFSSVLTVILAALSFGYWFGGKLADKYHSLRQLYSIIAISGTLVLVFEWIAISFLPTYAPTFGVMDGPLVFSFVLFFLPAFLLGIVSPYIIKIQSQETPESQIGSVVGQTFFFGTMGSIVGSLSAGYFFIPHYGVHQSILITGAVLVSLGILGAGWLKAAVPGNLGILLIATSLISFFSVQSIEAAPEPGVLYKDDGLYSSIKVTQKIQYDRVIRLLNRDRNNSSAIYLTDTTLPFPYTQFATFYPELAPDAERFLVLGGGTFTIPRTLHYEHPELLIDVVEIEPILYQVAKEYFDLPETDKIRNFSTDARVYLTQNNTKYDVIFVDAFGTDLAAPFHLTTTEFYQLVSERLTDNGILMVNFVGVPKTTRPSLFGSVVNTIAEVFPGIAAYGIEFDDLKQQQNVMLIAQKDNDTIAFTNSSVRYSDGMELPTETLRIDLRPFDFSKELILTDDHAPVEWLQARQ